VWRIRSRIRLFSIPDPNCLHPGSRIRTVSIPDPGSSAKNLSILTTKKAKKWFLSSIKYDPGCSSRIPDPDADFLPSRIPGSKRHPIPDPGSATLTDYVQNLCRRTNCVPNYITCVAGMSCSLVIIADMRAFLACSRVACASFLQDFTKMNFREKKFFV